MIYFIIVIVMLLLAFLFCALKLSSMLSRLEEDSDGRE